MQAPLTDKILSPVGDKSIPRWLHAKDVDLPIILPHKQEETKRQNQKTGSKTPKAPDHDCHRHPKTSKKPYPISARSQNRDRAPSLWPMVLGKKAFKLRHLPFKHTVQHGLLVTDLLLELFMKRLLKGLELGGLCGSGLLKMSPLMVELVLQLLDVARLLSGRLLYNLLQLAGVSMHLCHFLFQLLDFVMNNRF